MSVANLGATARLRVATGLLLGLAAVWGSTFFLIRDLVQTVPAPDFLGIRFLLAALAMTILFHRQVASLTPPQLLTGAGLGLLYGLAQLAQTQGLATTPAAISGFITSTYVVLTPIFAAVLLREHVPGTTWGAVAMATAGVALLSLGGLSVGTGEALTLCSAAAYALHIVALGRFSGPETATGLAVVQVWVIALMCLAAASPGGIVLPHGTDQWLVVGYMVVFASIFAVWGQTWAQAHMSATRAAVIMVLEPVFAAGFAAVFGGETLTWRTLVGGALVIAAVLVIEGLAARTPGALDPEAHHHDVS